jgi:hypothetical protein
MATYSIANKLSDIEKQINDIKRLTRNPKSKTPTGGFIRLEKIGGITGDVDSTPIVSECPSMINSFEL